MSGPGTMILVVGASGAGKDSLLGAARDALADDPRWMFPTRIITRHAGYGGEDHRPVDDDEFERLVENGGAALHWRAHGFGYAIPVEARAAVETGVSVVANVSRTVIEAARAAFERVDVVHVRVSQQVLHERLAARGREGDAEIRRRLERAARLRPQGPGVVEFVNHAPLERSAREFVSVLELIADARRGTLP